MEKRSVQYRQYLNILREELRPAMGCTEPIAIAYAAAKARDVLGALPTDMTVAVSGNIIKNVKIARNNSVNGLLARNTVMIKSTEIIVFVLGSSLCMTEYPGKN